MASPYQCQPSSPNSDQVYFPNLPDFYFSYTNAAALRVGQDRTLTPTEINEGATYAFTVPAVSPERNCSGTVVSFQYCYQARASDIGQERNVFDFITLTRDGQNLTVMNRSPVNVTLQEDMCTDPPGNVQRICCTMQNIPNQLQFQLPASNFTFGVVNTNSNIRILNFLNSVTEFDVERFWVRQYGTVGPMPRDILSPGRNFSIRYDRSLLLIRFFIGKYVAIILI